MDKVEIDLLEVVAGLLLVPSLVCEALDGSFEVDLNIEVSSSAQHARFSADCSHCKSLDSFQVHP